MPRYRITSKKTGVHLGEYEAAGAAEALDAMAQDAGYADYNHAQQIGWAAWSHITPLVEAMEDDR